MKCYEGEGLGRVLVIELKRGDKVVESVEAAVKEKGIKNAYVASSVGSVQLMKSHRPTSLAEITEDEFLTIEEPFELGGISGTVIDGVPHLHFSMASPNQVQCGHLEYGSEVLYLVEITIVEILGLNLERRMTPQKVKRLFVKGERE